MNYRANAIISIIAKLQCGVFMSHSLGYMANNIDVDEAAQS